MCKYSEAADELAKALVMVPGYPPAQEAMAMLSEKRRTTKNEDDELALKSTQPITLKFQNAKLKDVFELLSKTTGINILFDKDVRDDFVSIFIKDASFKEVLNLILATNNLFMKKISDDTILIVPKLAQKLNQYQDLMIQTFYLSNVKAKDMINLLRTMLETKRIFVNEELNAVVIRDTPDKMKLAERIIEANDRNPAEVMFAVEILEVDKNKSSQVGWNLSPASATIQLTPNPITLNQLKSLTSDAFSFTLPSVIVDFMKQESDAKTLANPKIRVLDNKVAKITIGNKFPILLSTSAFSPTGTSTAGTVQPAGTSISTSVEYKDTGIKLTVEPNIHLNNDVTLKLTLTVTTLGSQVDLGNGTKQYQFGERNAESVLNIRDGETVIIGGLIQDEKRTAVTKIPALDDIPVLGKLFSDVGKSKVTTDLIMTITPHIVRLMETPDKETQGFWSGTEETYSVKPLFSEPTSPAEMKQPPPGPSGDRTHAHPHHPPPPPPPPPPPAQPTPKPQSLPAAPTTIPPAVLALRPSDATTSLNQEVSLAAEIRNAEDLTGAVENVSRVELSGSGQVIVK
jgi:general secretion pathway protein D